MASWGFSELRSTQNSHLYLLPTSPVVNTSPQSAFLSSSLSQRDCHHYIFCSLPPHSLMILRSRKEMLYSFNPLEIYNRLYCWSQSQRTKVHHVFYWSLRPHVTVIHHKGWVAFPKEWSYRHVGRKMSKDSPKGRN